MKLPKLLVAALVISGLLMADSPQPFFNGAVAATVTNVKASPANLYGFVIGNAAATACYLQIFNATAANVTLGTTVPALSIPVTFQTSGTGGIALSFMNSPVPFTAAMSVAGTTTATGSTPCGTALVVNILFL